jgi:regulator of protease activity HflC (stomatin/prohibitin superfamily)
MMYIPLDWLFIIAILLALSIKILRGDERMVVLRLGRFLKVVGPGLVWLIPIIDKGIKVNLSKQFPGWQVVSKTELEEKIKASVLNDSGTQN